MAGADRTHFHGQLDGLVWLEVFLTYSGNRYHSFARIQLGLGHGGHSVLKGGGATNVTNGETVVTNLSDVLSGL